MITYYGQLCHIYIQFKRMPYSTSTLFSMKKFQADCKVTYYSSHELTVLFKYIRKHQLDRWDEGKKF